MKRNKQEKKPEIEQLERDLYSHMHHYQKLHNYRFKIEELERMIEKSKPLFDDPHHNRRVALITQKEFVFDEMKKSRHYISVQYIENLLDKINPTDKILISDKFFYKESYHDIAKRYGFDGEEGKLRMYRTIQRILQRMIR